MSELRVTIVGRPDARSDAAVARFLERFLEREHPGTVWRVVAPDRADRSDSPESLGGIGSVDDL